MSDLPSANQASQTSRKSKQREIRVVTGSRLHFGLLDTVEPFGGIGVMIDSPQTELVVCDAQSFEYHGPRSAHVRKIASRAAEVAGLDRALPPCRIDVVRYAPRHRGLGSGTQLSMAVAEAIVRHQGILLDEGCLSTRIASRGKRSAVGIHGYFHGGLILECSTSSGGLNPIQERVSLPETWCVAVLSPTTRQESVHGADEAKKFAMLPPAQASVRRELARIANETLMPSAAEGDFEAWSRALHQYNRSSGMLFAPIQGGPYNGPRMEALIEWLQHRGVAGVGQSSWGPGVFAWFESREHAEPIVRRLPEGVELITVTHVRNEGRLIEENG